MPKGGAASGEDLTRVCAEGGRRSERWEYFIRQASYQVLTQPVDLLTKLVGHARIAVQRRDVSAHACYIRPQHVQLQRSSAFGCIECTRECGGSAVSRHYSA